MKAAALAMIAILVSMVVVCPTLACPMRADIQPADNSCCHGKSHPRTSPDCPYLLLEKSKSNPGAVHVVLDLAAAAPHFSAPVLQQTGVAPAADRVVNAAGLFLRNRVLLI